MTHLMNFDRAVQSRSLRTATIFYVRWMIEGEVNGRQVQEGRRMKERGRKGIPHPQRWSGKSKMCKLARCRLLHFPLQLA
jgi:hypothetical protein